jgi:hypothetical protein
MEPGGAVESSGDNAMGQTRLTRVIPAHIPFSPLLLLLLFANPPISLRWWLSETSRERQECGGGER